MKQNLLVAMAALAAAGCSDVPLLPKWDTEWSFPLVSQSSDQLFGNSTVTVQPGTSFSITLPMQWIALDGQLGTILGQQITNMSMVMEMSKDMAVGGSYTLAVARDSAGLAGGQDPSNIALNFQMSPAAQLASDSVAVDLAGLTMIQNVADQGGRLWVQLRGQTTFGGSSSIVIAPSDSIAVRITLHATIAASN